MKTVWKPWGKEEWLELNDKYCYKRIYINAGHKTSLQVHNFKTETNYIISGDAHVTLGDSFRLLSTGDFFTVKPGTVHRVEAITDLILQEVSTPEVDDVIRLEDDTIRENGRIEYEHQRPALCILTAGSGTRIKQYSNWTNKALLPIGDKAAISHLIDGVSEDFEIVIALGHKADMVREYVEASHGDRSLKFVYVDNYDGEGSGPGTSLLACKDHLQRPFIWAVSDCYIEGGEIPPLDGNWVGVSPTSIPEIYSTFNINDGKICGFRNKNSRGFDWAFIGISGIYDYEHWWTEATEQEAVSPFYDYDCFIPWLEPRYLEWHDIGTIDSYQSLLKKVGKISLDKITEEFSYHIGNKFIKLFSDFNKCIDIAERAKSNLTDLVPPNVRAGKYVLSYDWVDGHPLYQYPTYLIDFLPWAQNHLWKNRFYAHSDFVKNKLEIRIPQLLKDLDIPWSEISSSWYSYQVHGDLQPDNIIINNDKFYLIDWRDNFESYAGDIYYDLGKLYGGIQIHYNAAKYEMFNSMGDIAIGEFEYWVTENDYDLRKIKWNTALIWLAMMPLHPDPFSSYLKDRALSLIEELNG